MTDPRDRVEINGRVVQGGAGRATPPSREKKFLSVWFRCCHTYGRMYRNKAQTAFAGRCPKCGGRVEALIGEGGSDRRVFEAE